MNSARSVTLQLGGEWRGNYGSAPCPICQPERRADQRALAVREAAGILLIYCHKAGCGFHDICRRLDLPCSASISPVQVHRLVKDKRELQVTAQLQRARLLWRQSVSINGSMAESYLRARGITCALPPTLRWHPDLHHGPSGVRLSAMVSLVEPTSAVHRTFFNCDGSRVERAA